MQTDLMNGINSKKLTLEKEIQRWHDRVNISKKSQSDWAESSGANRFIKEYKGDYGIVFQMRNRRVPIPPINEVFAYVQSDIATTYSRDPYIAVNAKAGTTKGAALWEVQLNYYWRELKTKEELEYEIIDKDLVGYGFHKVGMNITSQGSPDALEIKDENLYSKFLSWRDVIWNINSKRPPVDCDWMAQRIVMDLETIKKKWKNAKSLEGTVNPDINQDDAKKVSYKDDIKVGVIWEIWDARTRQIFLIAEGLEKKYLEDPKPWPDYLDEFPFLMYWDFAVPDSARPMSAIAPWEAQILEEMVLMGSAMNHTKRWNRQLFLKGGSIDEVALDKFERGDDGAVITVNGSLEESSFKFADFGTLPVDFYLLMDRLQAIKRNVNGQPEFIRGGVTKTGTRTSGELGLIQQGAKGRQDRKVDRLETHCENIARQMMANLKGNFDFEKTLKITGELPEEVLEALGKNYNPITQEVKFSVDDIQGEYDVEIRSGSTLALDKQTRLQIYEIVLNSVAQLGVEGVTSPFINALVQGLLQDYDVKSIQEAYELEVQQAQQAKAQEAQSQNINDEKVKAETAKREEQAYNIQTEAAIKEQELQLGPLGRSMMKRVEKPPKEPALNGR
jgi:hypothetical protein